MIEIFRTGSVPGNERATSLDSHVSFLS
jgi:hypothetical protein